LPSNEYLPALQLPNVELVTEGISEIREHGIATRDGKERPVDALILATGFQAAEAVAPFDIRGRGGRELNEVWREGAEAYLGTTVSGFPNAFIIVGPNTGLGHTSMILMIESQIQYIVSCLRLMRSQGLREVDVRPEAQATYNRQIQARLAKSVWSTGGCMSWYMTRSGRNTTLWPGFTFEFRYRTRRFDPQSYQLAGEKPAASPVATTGAQP
jgi:cation diffusion facilitator CzcD-associated flavoprotein CzcO